MTRPFVITVASEKGGVGKTTIATNLAVYLKALREELPVTIASFDNHFSVDQMFCLGPRPQLSVAALLGSEPAPPMVNLGQYGVQYIASERRLCPPVHQPGWLRQRLTDLDLEGILVLDTRPMLDWFTEAAVLAADLVLVPIKDRASLLNASCLRQVLKTVGRDSCLWLVPSLVDTRARLNDQVRVHDFLRFAASERDYQVVGTQISKSPKVESLASGFSSRILSVLTHARGTAVHGQFRALAGFVLSRFDKQLNNPETVEVLSELPDEPGVLRRRLVAECPACCQQALSSPGHFFFDMRSRRRGLIHPGCLTGLVKDLEVFDLAAADGLVGLTIDGPGLIGPEPSVTLHLFDGQGDYVVSERLTIEALPELEALLAFMTGRPLAQSYHELILLRGFAQPVQQLLDAPAWASFRQLRRRIVRELRQAGVY